MVIEVPLNSENDKLFHLLLNEIAITQGIAERWSSYARFYVGVMFSSIIAFFTIGFDNWNWLIFGVGLYSFVMFVECATRQTRASNIENALRSQVVRPCFQLSNDDHKSVYGTIIALAEKRRRIVSVQGYIDTVRNKNRDLVEIMKDAHEEANAYSQKKE